MKKRENTSSRKTLHIIIIMIMIIIIIITITITLTITIIIIIGHSLRRAQQTRPPRHK